MTSRNRLALPLVVALVGLAGCSEGLFSTGTIAYAPSDRLALDLKDKPKVQQRVTAQVEKLFGATPQEIRVPAGAGSALPDGGRHLGNYVAVETDGKVGSFEPAVYVDSVTNKKTAQAGGYALYRQHCLHCHGLSGDGAGPTADFLWPRPRDYRKGVFKFTSTSTAKPARSDLRRTIRDGVMNSSMPSFETMMSGDEIEQVIDYVIFLSARGETELALINEVRDVEEPKDDAGVKSLEETLSDETARGVVANIFEAWRNAEGDVLNPAVKRVPPSAASIAAGKEMFLGRTKEKLQCAGCHGNRANGDGPSFIPYDTFRRVVFRQEKVDKYDDLALLDAVAGQPEGAPVEKLPKDYLSTPGMGALRYIPTTELIDRLVAAGQLERDGDKVRVSKAVDKAYLDEIRKERELWLASLDDWGQPLRPSNLNSPYYKGGRRPLDLYWRIGKGINGAKMPAHLSTFPNNPEKIWDLVNFVMALPDRPDLLEDVPALGAVEAAPAVARGDGASR